MDLGVNEYFELHLSELRTNFDEIVHKRDECTNRLHFVDNTIRFNGFWVRIIRLTAALFVRGC